MTRSTSFLLQHALGCMAAVLLTVATIHAQHTEAEPQPDAERQLQRLEEVHREGRQNKANQMSGEDVRGREEWFTFQRRYPYDRIPAGARVNAIRDMQAMRQRMEQSASTKQNGRSLLAANRWENIGPDNFSGRVRAIAISPVDAQVVFIGAAAGGVWKTPDFGATWSTSFDTLSALALGALAIDPNNPDVIYAGTGENTANIDAYLGDGIFRSTDGGVTWGQLRELRSVGAFSKLHVHKDDSKILYAAAAKSQGGFYKSEDRGETWRRIVSGDVYDMTVNPQNNDEVYISFRNTIRRSLDGGNTFTATTTGMSLGNSVRISIGVAPSQPSRLYAIVARNPTGGGNQLGDFYVSDNKGNSWELKYTLDGSFFAQQGWYDNCLAVDPFDPNVVLIGGIDVYRTVDGGVTWTNTTRGYTGGTTHVDQHVLVFDRVTPGLVYLGNDGGVYASLDGGSNWQRISNQLPITQFYALEVDQTRPYRVYGGTQDNGTHGTYGTAGFAKDWRRVLGGDGFYVVVDLTDPNIIYVENYNGTPLYRADANNPDARTRIDREISPSAESGDVGYWSTPIAMSPADKQTLYTGRSKLWRSRNRGSNWEGLTTGGSGKISSIGLNNFDARLMLAGTVSGDLRYSLDDGQTWQRSTGTPNRFVTSIVCDPVNGDRVYATFSGFGAGRVYRSDDKGATFVNISSNLPNVPANAIAVDPKNPAHLFVGTDIGMFASLDGGEYWMPFNEGMANVPVAGLKIHTSTNTLVAATHGRSMYQVDISNVLQVPVLITPVGGEVFTTPGELAIRWIGFDGPVRIRISYDGGISYSEVAASVSGSSHTIALPLVRTDAARIRVEEIGSNRSVESGDFTINPTANGSELAKRGFIAEAIEVRQGYLWATVRNSDSLYKLRLQNLTAREGLVRTGIPGRIRDLAYNQSADIFYALVTNEAMGDATIYRMDSNGVGLGQMSLPSEISGAAGIAMTPEGLAVITPGPTPDIVILDASGGIIRRTGPLQGSSGGDRHGLIWDGLGYVQAVVRRDAGLPFPSELQHLSASDPLRIREATPVVIQSLNTLEFFGLAFDSSNADIGKRIYWATDTSGAFYRFEREKLFSSSVPGQGIVATGAAGMVAINDIVPNPAQNETTIRFSVRGRRAVSVELYDATGLRVTTVSDAIVDAGDHSVTLSVAGIASGIYYVAVRGGDGERDVRPLLVVK